jgi:hypothetical protein
MKEILSLLAGLKEFVKLVLQTFGRIHKTLRVTRALEAGIADHVWSLEKIAALAN